MDSGGDAAHETTVRRSGRRYAYKMDEDIELSKAERATPSLTQIFNPAIRTLNVDFRYTPYGHRSLEEKQDSTGIRRYSNEPLIPGVLLGPERFFFPASSRPDLCGCSVVEHGL
jgi:hypothetical protein